MDHVSDSFLEADGPLHLLIETAQEGREAELAECAQVFEEHAKKLVEVAHLACSMSNNEDGVKMVHYAAAQVKNLCPHVSLIIELEKLLLIPGNKIEIFLY